MINKICFFQQCVLLKNRYVFLKNQYVKIVTRKKNNIFVFLLYINKNKGSYYRATKDGM